MARLLPRGERHEGYAALKKYIEMLLYANFNKNRNCNFFNFSRHLILLPCIDFLAASSKLTLFDWFLVYVILFNVFRCFALGFSAVNVAMRITITLSF